MATNRAGGCKKSGASGAKIQKIVVSSLSKNNTKMKKILIVGAGGQIGSELVPFLRSIYGSESVVATDVRECKSLSEDGPFEVLDALNAVKVAGEGMRTVELAGELV